MGQLERYGLYVLVLVIFLILGVAIWGGDPAEARRRASPGVQTDPQRAARSTERAPASGFFEVQPARVLPVAARPAATRPEPRPVRPGPAAEARPSRPESKLGGLAPAHPEPQRAEAAEAGPASRAPTTAQPLERAVTTRRTYRVRPGDTIEGIARRELGSVRYVRPILDLNRSVDPRRMREGTVLVLPEPQARPRPKKAGSGEGKPSASGRTYRFRKGDSLWTVSRKLYGSAKYVRAIMEANGIEDPRRIRPGTVLRIPDPD